MLYRETYGKRLGPLGKKFRILRKRVKFWLFSQNSKCSVEQTAYMTWKLPHLHLHSRTFLSVIVTYSVCMRERVGSTLCLRVCVLGGGVHAWVRCGFWVNVFKCIYLNAKHVKMTWDKTCCITKLTCCLNSGSWTSDVNSQPNLADVPLHQQECLTNMFF